MESNQNQPYADPGILRKLRQGTKESLFVKPIHNFPLLASKRTHQLSRKVLDVFLDREYSDSDEVLRQEGFYDSTDKRCCINKSRR